MTLQVKYNKLENDCFNPLTVDPNPPHDLNHFSLFLRLENTVVRFLPTPHAIARRVIRVILRRLGHLKQSRLTVCTSAHRSGLA